MRLTFSIRKIISVLVLVTAILAVLTVTAQLFRIVADPPIRNLFGLVTLLDIKKEESIHTWYSEVLLLFSSILLTVVWLVKRGEGDRYAPHWAGLSVLLLFLSIDEGAAVHEKMGQLGKSILRIIDVSPTGFLAYSWIVPAFVLVLAIMGLYARFFFHLHNRERVLFSLSLALFIGASIFLESLSAFYVTFHGGQQGMTLVQTVTVILMTTAEEVTEVVAVIVLIYALLSYLGPRLGGLTVEIKKRGLTSEQGAGRRARR